MKATVNYRLYNLLKSATTLNKEVIAKEFGIKPVSVPVYIHEFKKAIKTAVIENIMDGRKVIAYKLITKDLKVPQYRKNAAGAVPTKAKMPRKGATASTAIVLEDGSVPVLDTDTGNVSEREFADIRSSLGIGSGSVGHTAD